MKIRFLPLVFLIIAGCGIFETRDAENPGDGSGIAFIQPDRPEIVLINIQNAIESMATVNYTRSLVVENFVFIPSGLAIDNSPEIWVNWSRDDEEVYFNNMRAATQNLTGHRLQLQNEVRTSLPSGDERISANYTLTVNHNRTGAGIPTVASGSFVMDITQGEDGLWAVKEWTDNAAGSSFTWSDFKAVFYRD